MEEQQEIILKQRRVIEGLGERVAALEVEIEGLRSQLGGGSGGIVPPWVKPNRPERKKKDRKKRYKAFVRRRDPPAEVVEHAFDRCPDCGRRLTGGSAHHYRLARPYCRRDVPQRVLAKRIEAFLPEMFMFVEHPEVSSDNNPAERALRPIVTARKVSGGTRSARGSATRMTLMILFGTWTIRGLDAMEACRKMLGGESPVSSAAIG